MFKEFIRKNLLLIGYMLLMTAFLYLRDINGVNVSKMIFVGIAVFASIFCNYQSFVSLIMFTLPLTCGLPYRYIMPFWLILLLLKCRKIKGYNVTSALRFSLLLLLFESSHYMFYDFAVDYLDLMCYMISVFLLAVFATNDTQQEYKDYIVSFCMGCSVLLVLIFLIYSKDPSAMYLEGGSRMGGDVEIDTEMMLRTNANNVGFYSASCIACMFVLYYYKKVSLYLFLPITLLSFYCGMFSVSRTWALSLALLLVLYFALQKERDWKSYAFVGCVLLGGVYFFIQNPLFLEMFLDRFTDSDMATGANRTTYFADYNSFLLDHPANLFLGTGAQIYREVCGMQHSSHNGLQQIWICYGVVGFILCVCLFLRLFKKYSCKNQYMVASPMIVILFFLQTIQLINPYNGLYPIIAAFFVMKMVKQDETNKLS